MELRGSKLVEQLRSWIFPTQKSYFSIFVARLHAYIRARMHTGVHICRYARIYAYMRAYVHICTHICIYALGASDPTRILAGEMEGVGGRGGGGAGGRGAGGREAFVGTAGGGGGRTFQERMERTKKKQPLKIMILAIPNLSIRRTGRRMA